MQRFGVLLIAAFFALTIPSVLSSRNHGPPTTSDDGVAIPDSRSAAKAASPLMDPMIGTADPLVPPIALDMPVDVEGRISNGIMPTVLWTDEFDADDRAHFHPHGSAYCASGCALHNHPTKDLTRAEFHGLLNQFANEPMDNSSFALESLVYYARQTNRLIEREGTKPLDDQRAAFLRRELARTHARIAIRLVDNAGEVRAWLPPTRVPLDRRHVFDMEVNNVQPLITSGTVKRVGKDHLWNRL